MRKIFLDAKHRAGLTIMIFAEGTVLKPRAWFSLYSFKSYVPIGNAAEIIRSWSDQGANIIYCTSRKKRKAEVIAQLLDSCGFPGVFVAARENAETYKDIAESLKPDILVEDDCRSIGGAHQTCIYNVRADIKQHIKSVVVPEFRGIDHLPSDIESLLKL